MSANHKARGAFKVWPLVGSAAIATKKGNAFRLWVLACHLDQEGSGKVGRQELKEFILQLGIEDRTYRRWLKDAVQNQLLRPNRSHNCYLVSSLGEAAKSVKCRKIGRPVRMPVDQITSPNWKAHILAGVHALYPSPVTREFLKKVTGISLRSQARYDSQNGVIRKKNYIPLRANKHCGKSGRRAYDLSRDLAGYKEARNTSAVFVRLRQGKAPQILERKPDFRISPYVIWSKGRSRKAQKSINATRLVNLKPGPYVRLFYDRTFSLARILEKSGRGKTKPFISAPREIFANPVIGPTSTIWTAYTTQNA